MQSKSFSLLVQKFCMLLCMRPLILAMGILVSSYSHFFHRMLTRL